jgi:hypothetical protein
VNLGSFLCCEAGGRYTWLAPQFFTDTLQAISEGIILYYLKNSRRSPSKGLKGKFSPQYGIGGKLVKQIKN